MAKHILLPLLFSLLLASPGLASPVTLQVSQNLPQLVRVVFHLVALMNLGLLLWVVWGAVRAYGNAGVANRGRYLLAEAGWIFMPAVILSYLAVELL